MAGGGRELTLSLATVMYVGGLAGVPTPPRAGLCVLGLLVEIHRCAVV